VDKFRGRGIVQPVEALTRPLRPARDGTIGYGPAAAPRVAPAALPQEEPDVLRGTRDDAGWWGLFGGGALVVAMLLRPVLSRRRS
jgi:membrane-anchored mycosin MYCP